MIVVVDPVIVVTDSFAVLPSPQYVTFPVVPAHLFDCYTACTMLVTLPTLRYLAGASPVDLRF